MRTVTFKSVLHGAAIRMGIKPAELLANDAEALTEYIDDHLGEAWEQLPWPEWTRSELRQFRASYNAGTTYAIGAEVYDAATNAYYRSLQNANVGNALTDTAWWTPATDLDTYIARAQSWEDNEMGEIWGVYADDPRTHERPRKLPFWETPNGIQVRASLTRVYVEFSDPAPHFSSEVWSASTAYAAGVLKYLPETGECYRALQASTGMNPSSSPTFWEKQDFPSVLTKAIKMSVMADKLREDEEFDKAAAQQTRASEELNNAFDRAMRLVRDQGGYEAKTT